MALLEKLLSFYHLSYQDYEELTKYVTLDNFNDGHELNNANEAVKLINESIKKTTPTTHKNKKK